MTGAKASRATTAAKPRRRQDSGEEAFKMSPDSTPRTVPMAHQVHGDGPALFLLAGTGYSGGTWPREMVDLLARQFSVVTFDYRGTGDTPGTAEEYTTRLFADDVRALIETLGRGPAHLLGHSMGGRVAQWVAIDSPELVRSLVMASSGPGEYRPGVTQYTGIPPSAAEQMIERGYEGYMRYQIETTFFTPEDHARRKDVVEELIRSFWAGRPTLHEYLKHVAARQGHRTVDRLGEIRQPSLVQVGDSDTHVGGTGPHVEQSRHLASALPNATLQIIEGSAHGYFWTLASKVVPDVTAFLVAAG
jgi:pimeloyl-ACP methyl ester carboxylesterase